MGNKRRISIGTLIVLGIFGWTINGLAAPPSSNKPGSGSKNIETNPNPASVPARPDLIIEFVKIFPENPELLKNLTVQFSVKNIGAAVAAPTQVIIYGLADLTEILKPDKDSTSQLAPGQSQVFTRSGLLDTQKYHIATGVHYFNVRIEQSIKETNYYNNYGSKVFNIFPPGGPTSPLPDIAVSAFFMTPANPTNGAPVTTTVTFTNNGPGAAPATQVYFTATGNAILTALGLPQPMKKYFTVPALNPGQSATSNFQAPNNKLELNPGNYFLDVRANEPVGSYSETNAQNNYRRLNFTVQSPMAPNMNLREPSVPKLPNPK